MQYRDPALRLAASHAASGKSPSKPATSRNLATKSGSVKQLEGLDQCLIIATTLLHLLPIIDRAKRLVARGLPLTELPPPDDVDHDKDRSTAECCGQCPAAGAWATGARISTVVDGW